ncbi:Klra5 [Phodopus roborovskii]|uniref:Klra5 protein n=1 Tax=Phodopus roborovskii TaxID=109678 RepID=A0AAV0A9A5_PHORO|nr:Klra5 [Phodopus roborovskii]
MQNDSYLRKEMLRNKPTKHLDSLNRKQKRCCRKIEVVLDCYQHTGKHVDMFCRGIKCYYFSMNKKCWNGCKQTCQDCSLSLLKIDDNDELKFLQNQTNPENYWIGLSYDTRNTWQWIGTGSFLSPHSLTLVQDDLSVTKFNHSTRRCAFLSRTRLDDDGCDRHYHCICEKRLHIL